MTIRTLLLTSLLLPVLAACGEGATEGAATPAAIPPRAVRVAAVETGPAMPPVIATGVVSTREESRLSFKVGGLIRDILVREGDTVTAGQRLAVLETTEVDAGVMQAREAHAKARRDLQRGEQLFRDDVITREQLDDLGTAEAVARAQLDAAQFNRRYAEIVAPAAGRVLRRLAEPRELVGAGQPVLQVSRGEDGFTLKLGLSDREFVQLRLGDRAQLRFDALPGRVFAGTVVERGQAADPRTGTFPVELSIEAGDAPLASGLIGRAEIAASAGAAQSLDYVPLEALVEGSSQSSLLFLYDAKTQQVQEQRVAVAFLAGSRAALAGKLPAGSRVVTDGAAYLHAGETVRVVD